MQVGYQGEPGSHSHTAITHFYGKAEAVGFTSFKKVFDAVNSGKVQQCLVPIENSSVGTFWHVLDAAQEAGLHIIGEYQCVDDHVLCAHDETDVKDIDTIYSHPYVFDQCQTFILSRPNVSAVLSLDTAVCAKKVSLEKRAGSAAIVSSQCARLYGLKIILDSVADNLNSVTRYYVFSKTAALIERHMDPQTSLSVTLKNVTGSLAKAIVCFSNRDLKYMSF